MKYFVRSLKYFAKLCVVCVVALVLMSLLNMTPYTPVQMLWVLTQTAQGWVLIGATIVLSGFYPRFGFVTRKVEGDLHADRLSVIEAFDAIGYGLAGEQGEALQFRVRSPFSRLLLLGEDTITATQERSRIRIEGPGKQVVRAESQLLNMYQGK